MTPSPAERLVPITDPADPRVADYVSLREVSLRRHLESAEGLFIAEGTKVIARAIEAGYRPRSFLLAERWLTSLAEVLQRHPSTPVYLVSEQLAEMITGFHVHRGALASLHRESRHTVADLLTKRRLVIMEDIVDHANVGAILRCAAGLGWDGVLLSPRCADPLYRRSIKVSMGSVFSLPWARLAEWHQAPQLLGDHGFVTVALALADGAEDLRTVAERISRGAGEAGRDGSPGSKVAIMVGTEGAGLSDRWISAADLVATIPMAAGIDSLNVAAATAIACYALGRTFGETGQSSG